MAHQQPVKQCAIDQVQRQFQIDIVAQLARLSGRLEITPDFVALSPHTIGGSPIKLHLTVDNVDAATARAEEAGATLLRAPKDEFCGERTAQIADPFGYTWFLATPIENVTPDEMQRRWTAAMEGA